MSIVSFCNRIIEYSFYLIFLLVPLAFSGNTSELFEFNKMWLTFILTIFIATAWFTKAILEKKFTVQRTPLDIPILLFLLSQIISTIFTLDRHVSWWGYYSRFNGGLLSTITYIFLYYAFLSNLDIKHVLRTLKATIIGAIIVALWGLPSHFGYDPTCLVFRGTFDVSCWTDAFKPTIRIFSTLGQPAWLAAYLAAIIPLAAAYFINSKNKLLTTCYLLLTTLFYLDLIFANTRAGFIAFWIANIIFWGILFIKKLFTSKIFLRYFLIFNIVLLICTFFTYNPISVINKFTFSGIKESFTQKTTEQNKQPEKETSTPAQTNITDSGEIRKHVWKGAIDAWSANTLFGTGVETFAFAYYKFRPAEHNMTSEWDYLYNKAHNEYLNYLTTTGLFGLGTYLAFIGLFIFLTVKLIIKQSKNQEIQLLTIGLFSGWFSILVSNFFGFSVVIINLFLFLIPVLIFILNDMLPNKKFEFPANSQLSTLNSQLRPNPYQWTIITITLLISLLSLLNLIRYWQADTKYALGTNLNHAGAYREAYPLLAKANQIKPNEPVYTDELAINMAVLATGFAQQNDATNSSELASTAIALNNQVITKHPNNIVFWKNRVRLFYTLAQIDPKQQILYYQEALKAIQKASSLAPTDAKISYNLGVLYGQTGNIQKGIETLQQTIKLKPDYRDPYFALGIFYRQLAVDQNNRVVNADMQQKAIETYKFILEKISPNDEEVKKSLQEWEQNLVSGN